MSGLPDCVLGLREPNAGSGVGLFNHLLARRLGIPYIVLNDWRFPTGRNPLISWKFEELTAVQAQLVSAWIAHPDTSFRYALYLHTFAPTELEAQAVRGALHTFCGNDKIFRLILERFGPRATSRVFAPSLLDDRLREFCRPAPLQMFSFGMAAKVDRRRFAKLKELLTEAGCEYTLVCSLAVHQTSDGSCVDQAVEFFTRCFADRFVHLGTLTDMGVAYFLNISHVFVGFYADGVRSNNTTFNTALQYPPLIITNLDGDSPPEISEQPHILNVDCATSSQLQVFLRGTKPPDASDASQRFSWEELVSRIKSPWQRKRAMVA